MSIPVSWPVIGGVPYSIPVTGETNWGALTNYLVALSSAQGTQAQKFGARVAVSSPVIVTSATDCAVVVDLTLPGPATVQLPPGVQGQFFSISDGKGDAGTNNITVLPAVGETINNAASFVINSNNDAIGMIFNTFNNNWKITSQILSFSPGTVARSAIQAGTPDYVVYNNSATGLLDQEQYLDQIRGGFGTDTSAFSGVVKAIAGVFSAAPGNVTDSDIAAGANIEVSKLQPSTSAQWSAVITDETGTDKIVYSNTPTLNTPNITGDAVIFSGGPKQMSMGQRLFDLYPTGSITFAGLTVTGGNTTFTVGAGTGFVVDHVIGQIFTVSWAAFTAQVPATPTGITYIMIDRTGALILTTTRPSASQRRDNLFLGRVGAVGGIIVGAATTTTSSIAPAQNLMDLAEGIAAFRINGCIMSANGATLGIARSAGNIFQMGINFAAAPNDPNTRVITPAAPCNIVYATQTVLSTTIVTAVDPANYDVGGVITVVPNPASNTTIQRLYQFTGSGLTVGIHYGQAVYGSIAAAIAGINTEQFLVNPNVAGNAVLVGLLIVTKGATDLSNPAQALFLPASRFGETAVGASGVSVSTMQNTYNNSVSPEILTDSTRVAVTVRRGSAADTDNVIEAMNGAGTVTAGINGLGQFNKVTVTPPANTATLTIADNKVLTVSNSVVVSGTDGAAVNVGAGGTVAYRQDNLGVFAATTSSQLAGVMSDETGSGPLVFATSPDLTTPRVLDAAIFTQEATPAASAANENKLYPKSDDKWYSMNSAGVESPLGSGGGDTTFVNYFTNPGFEDTANGVQPAGWTGYDDGAVAIPIDGTGGTATGVTFLASTLTPIRGTKSVIMAKDAANRQGKGYSFLFTISEADKGVTSGVSFEMDTDTNYASGDCVFYIYDVTNSTLITPRSVSIPKLDNYGKFFSDFGLTSGTSYRFILHIASTSTAAWNLKLDTMVNSTTRVAVPGPVVGDWQSYTPIGNLTGATYTGRWKRTTSDIELVIDLAFTGLAGGTASFTNAQLLNGLGITLNTAALPNVIDAAMPMGTWAALDTGTSLGYQGNVNWASDTFFLYYATNTQVTASVPLAFNTGDNLSMRIRMPISEWAGSGSNFGPGAQVEYAADDGTNDVFGPNGALVPNIAFSAGTTNRDITFNSTNQPTQDLSLELNYRGNGWAKASDIFPFFTGNNTSSANSYGIQSYWTTATVYRVSFGNRGVGVTASNQDNGASAWASEFAGGTRFRIVKANPSAPVGFGPVSLTEQGLLPAGIYDRTGSGAWILGNQINTPYTTYHTTYKNFFSGTPGAVADTNGGFYLGANNFLATGRQPTRLSGLTGGTMAFIPRNNDGNGVIQFYVNLLADSATTGALTAGELTATGIWIFGTGNLDAASAAVVIKKSNAINNRLLAGVDAATRGFVRINAAQTNLEFESASDIRIKKDIVPLDGSLEKICNLNPISFRLKDSDSPIKSTGFIAQEFYEVFPDAVTKTDDGLGSLLPEGVEPWSMSDAILVAHLVRAVQELKSRIDALVAMPKK